MENYFNLFQKTPVDIYEKASEGSYSGEDKLVKLGEIKADIQPYKSAFYEEEFGFSSEFGFKMYCGENDYLKEGRYAVIDGSAYRIDYVEKWDMGMTAILSGQSWKGEI